MTTRVVKDDLCNDNASKQRTTIIQRTQTTYNVVLDILNGGGFVRFSRAFIECTAISAVAVLRALTRMHYANRPSANCRFIAFNNNNMSKRRLFFRIY